MPEQKDPDALRAARWLDNVRGDRLLARDGVEAPLAHVRLKLGPLMRQQPRARRELFRTPPRAASGRERSLERESSWADVDEHAQPSSPYVPPHRRMIQSPGASPRTLATLCLSCGPITADGALATTVVTSTSAVTSTITTITSALSSTPTVATMLVMGATLLAFALLWHLSGTVASVPAPPPPSSLPVSPSDFSFSSSPSSSYLQRQPTLPTPPPPSSHPRPCARLPRMRWPASRPSSLEVTATDAHMSQSAGWRTTH